MEEPIPLAFNAESLSAQKTNMRAALGRMVDVDIAEERQPIWPSIRFLIRQLRAC